MTTTASRRQMLLVVFVLSGFAGLIYQSIWSHYLGLFLGHAAYAQALVLALFMGGMAVGAAWIAKAGERWRNLIRWYALIELVIGVLGLLFHVIFTGVVGFSYDVLIPALGSPGVITALKWLLAAVLILPQTVLLGMTFPLMSGGLIRRYPGQDGNLLGGLYFTNSMGAALGALASAFVLLPAFGLPGALVTAGGVNVVVALLAWGLAREPEPEAARGSASGTDTQAAGGSVGMLRLVLWGTALSGAASFVYEIVWIRMLGMAVGSTMHAFELMLAAFIAGIALGGLWIRKRADRTDDPLRLVGWMQIFMGLAALLSLVFYANAFEWVGWLMAALSNNGGGYALFNLGTAGISVLIMMPAAFFAGTTLPLFTVALLRAGFGERSIGRVYAWNTMGSILGVFLAIHLLIPGLGLKLALCVGALVDMAIGLVLLRTRASSTRDMARFATGGVMAAAALVVAIVGISFDPLKMASGVFRTGRATLKASTELLFYQDGKTASVSAYRAENGTVSIATNGKPDASIAMRSGQAATADESTMVLAAALPLAIHPRPDHVGVIGFGSGLTTHAFLADPRIKRVDTVEIEKAMVVGAQVFGKRVLRAYTDPRSNIVIDDAKAYFAGQRGGYDIIISEPSNPWISGIGSLFSKEFYRFIPGQMKEDGLFVQWVQLYEINDELVSSILNAMTPAFGDYAAWISNGVDLIIVATPAEKLPEVDYSRVFSGALGADLHYAGIANESELQFRKIADARMLRALGRLFDDRVNSDFYPILSIEAPRARFVRSAADITRMLTALDIPLLEMAGISAPLGSAASMSSVYPGEVRAGTAQRLAGVIAQGGQDPEAQLSLDERARVAQLFDFGGRCIESTTQLRGFLIRLSQVGGITTTYLPREAALETWSRFSWEECATAESVVAAAALEIVRATAARDPESMKMAGEAWFALRAENKSDDLASMDESALFSLLLAAVGDTDWKSIPAIEARYGRGVASSEEGRNVRGLLLALADE